MKPIPKTELKLDQIPRRRERIITAELGVLLGSLFLRHIDELNLTNHEKLDRNDVAILRAVAVGHFRGYPMNLYLLARFTEIPRATVQRRLNRLMHGGLVRRLRHVYLLADQHALHTLPTFETIVQLIIRSGHELQRIQKAQNEHRHD